LVRSIAIVYVSYFVANVTAAAALLYLLVHAFTEKVQSEYILL